VLPTKSLFAINHRAVGLTSRTSFALAVALRPMVPLPEFVSTALLDKMSSVNEPFVPTITSPVMLVVTLLNVFVAPSATS
jgi:hypothetical protein